MHHNIQQTHAGVYWLGGGVRAKRESQASPPGKGSESEESKGQAELAFKGALPQVYRALLQPCNT